MRIILMHKIILSSGAGDEAAIMRNSSERTFNHRGMAIRKDRAVRDLSPVENERLRAGLAKLEKTMTQVEIAEEIGVGQSNVNRMIHGLQGGTLKSAEGVARLLGRDVYEFLGRPPPPMIVRAALPTLGDDPRFDEVLVHAQALAPHLPPAVWERVRGAALPGLTSLDPLGLMALATIIHQTGQAQPHKVRSGVHPIAPPPETPSKSTSPPRKR